MSEILPEQRRSVNDQMYAEEAPLPLRRALLALARCVLRSTWLIAFHRLRQPKRNVGRRIDFMDGTTGSVYRKTVLHDAAVDDPAALFVAFRLHAVRGRGHAAFRAESLLNTSLFVGFPGFRSKLWPRHDAEDKYRGIYQWNGAQAAQDYARALWWVLALVCPNASIHYKVLPGRHRDDVVDNSGTFARDAVEDGDAWWMPQTRAGRTR